MKSFLSICVFALSFFMVFLVNANPQLNLDTNSCHSPKWPNDTNDEWKHSCIVVLDEDSGEGAVAGYGILKVENVALVSRVDQQGVSPDPTTRPGNVVQTSENRNVVCTLTNDDGNQTTTADWAIVTKSNCTGNPSFCDFEYYIYCGYDIGEILQAYSS